MAKYLGREDQETSIIWLVMAQTSQELQILAEPEILEYKALRACIGSFIKSRDFVASRNYN